MAANADDPYGSQPHARINRQSAGESQACSHYALTSQRSAQDSTTPTMLYLTYIAVLEARVARLEATVEKKERDLQHVVDRYEHLVQQRDARHGEPTTAHTAVTMSTPGHSGGLLERIETLFG